MYFTVGNKQEMIEEENLLLETTEENNVTNKERVSTLEKDVKELAIL